MAIKVSGTIAIDNNKHCTIGSGTTAQRPTSPAVATLWFNTETNNLEGYNGAEWENVTEPLPADPDLTALSWGHNGSGRLGINDAINRSSPVTVVGGITDWTQIATGHSQHSLALRSDGVLYAWGIGSLGQLGTNDAITRSSPVTVVGGITDWTQIAVGSYHNLAIRSNGVLYAWGHNAHGRLGTNDTIDRSSPVTVVGGITDWIQIGIGNAHNIALRSNGVLYAWGRGNSGQLGTNNIGNQFSPVIVAGGITDWTQIAVGRFHNLALRSNGVLYAWGYNGSGRLGINNVITRSSPVIVVGGITDWTQIAAGNAHSLALRSDGVLYAWGDSGSGRLGTNDVLARSSPVTVVGGITDWTQISGGGSHNLALRSNGVLYAWGIGVAGRLGTNDTIDRSSPVTVVGGITDWTQIAAGTAHSLALRVAE